MARVESTQYTNGRLVAEDPLPIDFWGKARAGYKGALLVLIFVLGAANFLLHSGWIVSPAKQPDLDALTKTVVEVKERVAKMDEKLDNITRLASPAPAVPRKPAAHYKRAAGAEKGVVIRF